MGGNECSSQQQFLCGNPLTPILLVFQRSCRDLMHNRIRSFLLPEEQRRQVVEQMQRTRQGGECWLVLHSLGASSLTLMQRIVVMPVMKENSEENPATQYNIASFWLQEE